MSIPASRWRVWLGCCVLLLPAFELARHVAIVSSVPRDEDYLAAAEFVRAHLQPRDLVTSAPSFIDPIVRMYLGDRMSLAMVGRSDDSAYERMWVLSIRDDLPRDAPLTAAALTRQFGAVRVLRYDLGRTRVLFDFVNAWSSAQASLVHADHETACRIRSGGVPRGGGLGKPVLAPLRDRFDCDPARPWLFIGPMVMEDLDNTPRYCLWQHPQGDDPVRLRWRDVPLGDELVFYGGVYYEHERMRQGGIIEVSISIDGSERAKFQHRDGEGWKRMVVNTHELAAQRGDVQIDVRAHDPNQRSFCWAASTRSAPP